MPRSRFALLANQPPAPDEPPPLPKPKRKTAKDKAAEVKLAMRRARALKLAAGGYDLRRIAEKLTQEGYECSYVTVKHDLDALYKQYHTEAEDTLRRMRLIHEARGNQLIASIMPQLLDVPIDRKTGHPRADKATYERQFMLGKLLLEIEAHEAKLHGAFAPTRVQQEMTGKDGGPIQTENRNELAILSTTELAALAELARDAAPSDPATAGRGAPPSLDNGGEAA